LSWVFGDVKAVRDPVDGEPYVQFDVIDENGFRVELLFHVLDTKDLVAGLITALARHNDKQATRIAQMFLHPF
jgi:hypothetical protein